jgi:dihydroxyacetone kinase-like protein
MNPTLLTPVKKSIGPAETRDILYACLKTLSDNCDHLNALDQALGDGDHGSTMHRGAGAAMAALDAGNFTTVNAVFEAIGSAMMTSMGGASGILFGVWFRGAKFCAAASELDVATVKSIFERGLQDLAKKSPATIGDKTMMDALIPATGTLADVEGKSLTEVLRSMAASATTGAESTIGLLPRLGRATTLGERVRAAKDPGATSISIFFTTLAREVEKQNPE